MTLLYPISSVQWFMFVSFLYKEETVLSFSLFSPFSLSLSNIEGGIQHPSIPETVWFDITPELLSR